MADDLRPAPYPSDTRSRGWRLELDMERILQSDTWSLAPQEMRPWLLMLWCAAWCQIPCGSLPSDDALLVSKVGIPRALYDEHKALLLRGWWRADDGRLYHPVMTERVLELEAARASNRARQTRHRQSRAVVDPDAVTRDKRVSHAQSPVSNDTSTRTSTRRRDTEVQGEVVHVGESARGEAAPRPAVADATPSPPARRVSGSRIPDGFPDAEAIEWSHANTPSVDADREAATFRDYWLGKAGADGRKADWPATWRNWCRRSAEYAQKARASPRNGHPRPDRLATQAAVIRELTGGLAGALPNLETLDDDGRTVDAN